MNYTIILDLLEKNRKYLLLLELIVTFGTRIEETYCDLLLSHIDNRTI